MECKGLWTALAVVAILSLGAGCGAAKLASTLSKAAKAGSGLSKAGKAASGLGKATGVAEGIGAVRGSSRARLPSSLRGAGVSSTEIKFPQELRHLDNSQARLSSSLGGSSASPTEFKFPEGLRHLDNVGDLVPGSDDR